MHAVAVAYKKMVGNFVKTIPNSTKSGPDKNRST